MATIVTPMSDSFNRLTAELYGDRTSSDRALYRETVQSVADRAKAAMDVSLHGRIDKAAALVLAGDVELLPNGSAQVGSQTQGSTVYLVANGTCTCKDFGHGQAGPWCKHRLAAGLATRVQQALALAAERWAADEPSAACWQPINADGVPCYAVEEVCVHEVIATLVPDATPALPEAPASVNVRLTVQGRDVQWTLRDSDELRLLERLEALLARFPVEAPPVPSTPAAEVAAGWCPTHSLPMKLNEKEGRTWYSHKVGDTWCKGK